MKGIVLEYVPIVARSGNRLKELVNLLIRDGYEPQGGISITVSIFTGIAYAQAMVRRKENAEDVKTEVQSANRTQPGAVTFSQESAKQKE